MGLEKGEKDELNFFSPRRESADLVAEVLGDGQARQGHTRAGAGGLVHLPVHKGSLENF